MSWIFSLNFLIYGGVAKVIYFCHSFEQSNVSEIIQVKLGHF